MSDSEEEFRDTNHDNDPDYTEVPTRPRKRSRVAKSSKAGGSSLAGPRKRGRKAVTSLSELMNMPLDVFFEIVSHLHPLDLLQLIRTSKSLRSTLLDRNSVYVWRATLESIEDLPRCPEGMSEPFYSALLFDKVCQLCGGDRGSWVDFAIRMRLCKPCYKDNISSGSTILKGMKALTHLLSCAPCETGTNAYYVEDLADPLNHDVQHKYYIEDVHAMIARFFSLPKEEAVVKSKLAEWQSQTALRHQQAIPIIAYLRTLSTVKKQQLLITKTARSASIIAKLQELGYTETDFPEYNDAWHKLVYQSKELTDRIWSNIRPKLEELIEEERERQRKVAYASRVNKRFTRISKFYEEFLKGVLTDEERSMAPNAFDVRLLPSVRNLARRDDAQGELTQEDFLAITDDMLDELNAYQASAREVAIKAIRDQYSKETLAPFDDALLDSYFAYFRCDARAGWIVHCSSKDAVDLTFPDAHAHWRANHPKQSLLTKGDNRGDIHSRGTFVAKLRMLTFGARILEAAGLPLTTTRQTLDQLVREGRLYCSCGEPSMPLPTDLSWLKLYNHVHGRRMLYDHAVQLRDENGHQDIVLGDNHKLSGPECCIKLVPEGGDTAPASVRLKIDDELRAKVEARVNVEPDETPLCRVCKTFATSQRWNVNHIPALSHLPGTPEGIVYHLRSWHQKEFEDRDIAFITI